MQWHNPSDLSSAHEYDCGYCNVRVSSKTGLLSARSVGSHDFYSYIYICPNCHFPTFFEDGKIQHPGPAFGDKLSGLPKEIEPLYEEARQCMSVNSCTAAVMCCRKLLMNVAVDKGAPDGENYIYYVDYLVDKHYVHPDMGGWVDRIRQVGNEANHEIKIVERQKAENVVNFVMGLLRYLYEFPKMEQDSKSSDT